MLINPGKTKFIVFGTGQLLSQIGDLTISFLGQELSLLSSCKDLGIIFDRYLSFDEHVDYLSSSLLVALCQINRVRVRGDQGDKGDIGPTGPRGLAGV